MGKLSDYGKETKTTRGMKQQRPKRNARQRTPDKNPCGANSWTETARGKPIPKLLECCVYCCGLRCRVKSSRLRHIDAADEDDISSGIVN